MLRFGRAVARRRVLVLIITLALLVPSVFGMAATRVNYDLLVYLPKNLDTMVGQEILTEEFGIGSFSFLILEGMSNREVSSLKQEIVKIDHVKGALWYDSLLDLSVPMEALPEKVLSAFNRDGATVMLIFLDTTTSEDGSLQAVEKIRALAGERCFVAGMSALVVDLKNLGQSEEPVYVALAVACATLMMMLLLDGWLIPFVFLLGIGAAILLNMGTNFFLGDISYITKALAAVLQLAVTMDYSIFLWHSYTALKDQLGDKDEAMALAIKETFSAILGSSATTIAGFLAFCAMSFTLGIDLGLVMAKGVLLGLACSLTVLPAMILCLDKPLTRTRHKPLLPPMKKLSSLIVRRRLIILIVFALLIVPAYIGYSGTNANVYYDMANAMPEDIDYVVSCLKLRDQFDIASTYLVMADANLPAGDARAMLEEINAVTGVRAALGLDSLVGPLIPPEALPDSLAGIVKSGRWELFLVSSAYHSSSNEMNAQLTKVSAIVSKYDEGGMLIGEAPLVQDMIRVTDTDFRVVTVLSVLAVFLIILLVTRSLTLPVILVAVIEFAVFLNFAITYFGGVSLVFLGPICISTIQLGSTVDYAILLSTRYQEARLRGDDKLAAATGALCGSLPSILTSALCFFSATFGVSLYSQIGIITALCELMARGAVISMLSVVLVLPGLLVLLDRPIRRTTLKLKAIRGEDSKA